LRRSPHGDDVKRRLSSHTHTQKEEEHTTCAHIGGGGELEAGRVRRYVMLGGCGCGLGVGHQ